MKLKSILLLITIVISFSTKAEDDIINIRNLFYRAVKSESASDTLHHKMYLKNENKNPAKLGYKSMSHFMICYHTYNPYSKYKNFIIGKNLMEDAIKQHPENIELRFLRLTTQLNVPSFLGYSSNIDSDKKMLLNNAYNIKDKDLLERIYKYTINAKKINELEKKEMQKALMQNPLFKEIKINELWNM